MISSELGSIMVWNVAPESSSGNLFQYSEPIGPKEPRGVIQYDRPAGPEAKRPRVLKTSGLGKVFDVHETDSPQERTDKEILFELFMAVYAIPHIQQTEEAFMKEVSNRISKFHSSDERLKALVSQVFPLLFE